jgi:hypothetical protein
MSAQQTHRFEYQLHLTFLFYVVFKIKFWAPGVSLKLFMIIVLIIT